MHAVRFMPLSVHSDSTAVRELNDTDAFLPRLLYRIATE